MLKLLANFEAGSADFLPARRADGIWHAKQLLFALDKDFQKPHKIVLLSQKLYLCKIAVCIFQNLQLRKSAFWVNRRMNLAKKSMSKRLEHKLQFFKHFISLFSVGVLSTTTTFCIGAT